MELTAENLRGWLPGKILWEAGEPTVVWRPLGPGRMIDPYFDDTLRTTATDPEPEGKTFHTPISLLREVAEAPQDEPGPGPAGFVFHWSRCGSTVVAQMLAASYTHLVLAESQPIDALLRCHLWDARATPEWQQEQLHWLVEASARATPHRTRLFIKFDCWHLLQLPVIRAAFPHVPWLFIYRDPLEVLASHEHRCGAQFVPGELEPELFGWELGDVMRRPFALHWAKMLAAFGQAALAGLPSGRGYLVNHDELPDAATNGILRALGVPRSPELLAEMAKTGRYHTKDPKTISGAVTTARLQQELPDHALAVAQHVAAVYAELETRRNGDFGLPEGSGN
jgi:hypothetical protein